MKKHTFLFAICWVLLLQSTDAQISLNLALNSRPLPYLSEWYKPINGQMLLIYNIGQPAIDPTIKLQTTLLDGNGNAIGISTITGATVYRLTEGVNIFSIADALQLQNLSLHGGISDLLGRSGRLLAGQYQLAVQVTDITGSTVYAEQARPFFVAAYQLPVLMQPANGVEINAAVAQSIITFRWTSVAPAMQEPIKYRLQVFEVLPGQTDMQAFRSNRPLLDEEVTKGANQYLWRSNLPMLDSTANQKFIWTVQTLDNENQPIPTNDALIQARSEPYVFTIRKRVSTVIK